jgi:hypothetical protein
MDRSDEAELAWSLVDAARSSLAPQALAAQCAAIATGDQDIAITELLNHLVLQEASIASNLIARLERWVSGYSCSPAEMLLRGLIESCRMHSCRRQLNTDHCAARWFLAAVATLL